ncbi:hypothetical protein [Brevibacterium oceani]|uniref:hypothetical protein n=1 Tax=Brevibacterium oceani TaxID=358099 RepID=UPI0015E6571F|nr:hypothetical protein [Brevibacterium oceani]
MSIDAQQIAEALQTDPFYVEDSVAGDLNPTLIDKAEATAQKADFDVYVIAVDTDHVDTDLLEQIKVHHGGQGSYVMINGGSDIAVDIHFEDQHELQMQVMEQLTIARSDWNVSSPSTTKLNTLLDLYADPQSAPNGDTSTVQEGQSSEVTTVDGSGSFASLFLGVAVFVLAVVIAGVWFFRSRRRRVLARRTQQQFQLPGRLLDRVDTLQRRSLRETIDSETLQLAAEIEDLQTRSLAAADSARVERGLDAYRIARRIVDDEEAERIDLAGAMVLLRQAGREIAEAKLGSRRGLGSRGARAGNGGVLAQSLCTINPLHGEAAAAERVIADAEAGRTVRVPVCQACLDDLRGRRELQWIYDGDRPYVEVASVWSDTLFGAIGGDLVSELHRHRSDLD